MRTCASPPHRGADRNAAAVITSVMIARRPLTGARIETASSPRSRHPAARRPLTGARIETACPVCCVTGSAVAPSQGRGSKRRDRKTLSTRPSSPPHRGADRNALPDAINDVIRRRPLTGARIETAAFTISSVVCMVAPSQGRGSKPDLLDTPAALRCRPLTGARIETVQAALEALGSKVAPSQGRGSKPPLPPSLSACRYVAPSQGRGSKPTCATR